MSRPLSESVVLELVGRIYDAAAASELWPGFLERLADQVNGGQAQIVLYDVGETRGNLATTIRLDPSFKARYDEHYGALDCWGVHGRHLMTTGNVVTGQMLCPDAILGKSEFYNDFLRPLDCFHQFCGFIYKADTAVSLISTLRPQRSGPFGDQAVRLLQLLMPHLQRAIQLHQRIAGLRSETGAVSDALDRLPIGFLATEGAGKVLLLNREAQRILDLNDGLTLKTSGLVTPRREETNRLRGLIHGAIGTRSGKGLHSGGVMTISRPSLRDAFQILVTPLRETGSWLWPVRSVAGIFLFDPDMQESPPDRVLRQLFGLSAAEARLAAAIMKGNSLDEAAEEFRLSRNTLRSQLRSIFDKTATRRQNDLIRLLNRGPAKLRTE